ncbi:MAG TPA: hypothetical protein VMS17_20230 [Gemmataceae bacterium]|nr:hypothetical protein [Gemmataceae bacterium]
MPYESTAAGQQLHGLPSITAYCNDDGALSRTNCGLAAAATGLCHRQLFAEKTLAVLEKRLPPDVLFGLFGTSKTRVCKILSAYRCRWHEIKGRRALRDALERQRPVLVMLGLPGRLPAGHWMVAYAYDEQSICLTNYRSHNDHMKWGTFFQCWNSWLSRLIGMSNRGIALD